MTRLPLITLSPLFILTALFIFPRAVGADQDQVRFERALAAREKIPSKTDLLLLDPQAEKTLQQLVSHSSTKALVRSRAITLLQHFPSKATAITLLGVIDSASHPKAKGLALMDLGRALSSYAVVVGSSSLQRITPFLAHGNPDVRHEAARALRLSKNPEALRLLRNRLKMETLPFVRVQLEKQIAQIQRATAQ